MQFKDTLTVSCRIQQRHSAHMTHSALTLYAVDCMVKNGQGLSGTTFYVDAYHPRDLWKRRFVFCDRVMILSPYVALSICVHLRQVRALWVNPLTAGLGSEQYLRLTVQRYPWVSGGWGGGF